MRHSKYHLKYIVVPFLLVLICWHASAAQTELYIGLGLKNFNYAEYKDSGSFLDGESGLIPGILLNLRRDKPTSFTELEASIYYNKIEYDGQTQITNIPLKTLSDAVIIDTHFKLARKFKNNNSLYAGLGYRYWYRNINSGKIYTGQSVNPLLEEYDWFYFLAGIESEFMSSGSYIVGYDLRLTRMFNSRMKINYLGYGSKDNTQVILGDEFGVRFALPIKIVLENSSFILTPYYEIINIGKSNIVDSTSAGVIIGYVWEPRSETRSLGIELTWLW